MKRGYYNALKIIRRDGYKCKSCKSKLPLEKLLVHHIDKNPLNNKGNNLTTLCRRCHMFAHGNQSKDKKNSEIVEMRQMGFTFQEMAELYGLTKQRIHQIYRREYYLLTGGFPV